MQNMSWIKKIFKAKSSSKDEDKRRELLNKIELSIENCLMEISKSEKEIKQINKWMAELIHENFFVPGDFWYEELAHYEEIKNHKENALVSVEKTKQVDKLLHDYKTQIRFREKKIELKKLMIEKFNKAKEKLLDLSESQKENPVFEKFAKHQNRIQKLNEEQNSLSEEQEQDELLQQLMFKINELIENKKLDEEVKTFMKKLNQQFSADVYEEDPEKIIRQMERLIEEYKLKK